MEDLTAYKGQAVCYYFINGVEVKEPLKFWVEAEADSMKTAKSMLLDEARKQADKKIKEVGGDLAEHYDDIIILLKTIKKIDR
jgi:hypothetical protein